jgi:hypothetical protein
MIYYAEIDFFLASLNFLKESETEIAKKSETEIAGKNSLQLQKRNFILDIPECRIEFFLALLQLQLQFQIPVSADLFFAKRNHNALRSPQVRGAFFYIYGRR